jgi:hypothetical protein
MKNEFVRMKMLAGLITENQDKELKEDIGSSTPSQQTWGLWLKLSDENGIDGYDLEGWNHIQVGKFIKELQWIEDNKDKYSDEELSDNFSAYLDELTPLDKLTP